MAGEKKDKGLLDWALGGLFDDANGDGVGFDDVLKGITGVDLTNGFGMDDLGSAGGTALKGLGIWKLLGFFMGGDKGGSGSMTSWLFKNLLLPIVILGGVFMGGKYLLGQFNNAASGENQELAMDNGYTQDLELHNE